MGGPSIPIMQKIYTVLQVVAGVVAAGFVVSAVVIWTGVPVSAAIHTRNAGLALAGVFAIPCLAFWLAAKLGTAKALVFHTLSRRGNLALFVCFAAWMVAGLYSYPYAPIVMRDGALQDKQGRKYSFPEYERFVRWESSFAMLGASVFVGALASLPGGGMKVGKGARR